MLGLVSDVHESTCKISLVNATFLRYACDKLTVYQTIR